MPHTPATQRYGAAADVRELEYILTLLGSRRRPSATTLSTTTTPQQELLLLPTVTAWDLHRFHVSRGCGDNYYHNNNNHPYKYTAVQHALQVLGGSLLLSSQQQEPDELGTAPPQRRHSKAAAARRHRHLHHHNKNKPPHMALSSSSLTAASSGAASSALRRGTLLLGRVVHDKHNHKHAAHRSGPHTTMITTQRPDDGNNNNALRHNNNNSVVDYETNVIRLGPSESSEMEICFFDAVADDQEHHHAVEEGLVHIPATVPESPNNNNNNNIFSSWSPEAWWGNSPSWLQWKSLPGAPQHHLNCSEDIEAANHHHPQHNNTTPPHHPPIPTGSDPEDIPDHHPIPWFRHDGIPVLIHAATGEAVERLGQFPDDDDDNDADDDAEEFDLVQILSILIIPTLAQMDHQDHDMYHHHHHHHPQQHRPTPPNSKPALSHRTRSFVSREWGQLALSSASKSSSQSLTAEDIRQLLLRHGETERAKNDALVEEMANMARQYSSSNATVNANWNGDWFLGLLTDDVREVWNLRPNNDGHNEDEYHDDIQASSWSPKHQDVEGGHANVARLRSTTTTTSMNMDLVMDSHVSVALVVAAWAFASVSALVYGSILTVELYTVAVCGQDGATACQIAHPMLAALGGASFTSLLGYGLLAPMVLTNNRHQRNWKLQLASVLLVVSYTVLPYYALELVKDLEQPEEGFRNGHLRALVYSPAFEAGQSFAWCLGIILACLYAITWTWGSLRARVQSPAWRAWWQPSNVRSHQRLRRAATSKLNDFLEHAVSLRDQWTGDDDNGDVTVSSNMHLEAMVETSDESVPSGGCLWLWRQILRHGLLGREGIELSTRLVLTQCAQLAVAVVVMWSVLAGGHAILQDWQAAVDTLPTDTPAWVYNVLPRRRHLEVCLHISVGVAIVTQVVLMVRYIPSAVSTILKFRGRLVEDSTVSKFSSRLFRGSAKQGQREAIGSEYKSTADGVWSLLLSAALAFALTFGTLFLFLYQPTRSPMMVFWGSHLGLCSSLILHQLWASQSAMVLRRSSRSLFYRSYPVIAQRRSLALECWYALLAASVALNRFLMRLFASVFEIGGDGGDRHGPATLDKDTISPAALNLLVHEAHRHPYVDRLALVLSKKLQHGRSFGTAAGAAWRQLALLILCPWLSRYRRQNLNQPEPIWMGDNMSDRRGVATLEL